MYHVYTIRVKNRDDIMRFLADRDIHCGIHYPVPVHLQDAYDSLLIPNGDCPIAETCAKELLSLPMYPELIFDQQKQVVENIKDFSQTNL